MEIFLFLMQSYGRQFFLAIPKSVRLHRALKIYPFEYGVAFGLSLILRWIILPSASRTGFQPICAEFPHAIR